MFKTNPKIKSISSCSSGDFLFVFGLGKDGQCYIWNSTECAWLPHQNMAPQNPGPAPEIALPETKKNFQVNKKK